MRKVIIAVLSVILGFQCVSAQVSKENITLDELFKKGTFRAKSIWGLNPMNNDEFYSAFNSKGQIAVFKLSTGEQEKVIFDPSSFDNSDLKSLSSYELSSDESMILLATNVKPIYRRSYTAEFYVYNINTKELRKLSDNGAQMNAAFSPDGKKVAFVRDNNIFIVDLLTFKEKQITFDGKYNSIINGDPDWVYEEEFALTTGIQWSPDSKKIAFYRFDESRVKLFNMTTYNRELYPENYTFKYPKAGEENSIVTIHVFDLESNSTKKMDVGPETDQYIARIKWMPLSDKLCMIRLNRLQNKVDILVADITTGNSEVAFSESNKYYIEEVSDDYLTITPDGKKFILTSERDGYMHIYLYDIQSKKITQLTSGTNEVSAIYGFDTKRNTIYYQGYDQSPLRKAIYSVNLKGKVKKLSSKSGTNSAVFSRNYKYVMIYNSSITEPLSVVLFTTKGKQVRVMEDNHSLKERLSKYNIPQKEFFTFKTSEGVELNGYMVKPLNFDSTKHYPVMMYQYSGPGSQTVLDRFRIGWDEYLATLGYMVVCVDGRGTGGRGEQFKKMTYGQLGYYESIDQIETAKYLQTLPFVDASRIGIWGWSFGGYMSSLCLFKGADVFKMAIAVAPVTNWRYYDSIYTERYMGLPQDNPLGYDNNSPINHVDKLKGKFLLIHGTADDNVHFQNSIEMIEKLVQAGKQFDVMVYPDKNHSIRGGNTTMHLYTLMANYIKENL
ncbi:S9 family peptidase [Tenuifilum thalassicum]|uniref:Prolyl oligopeptidase family serine peptidase n=1 Tax=Tenuifilum thalassicum TaxID=2590900 RepID=A0A7D4BDI4_9BACT|nr:S9 family peptidase [Tenuifilum thalassicum]QKG79803.1 prolyl oligopeptidase family serine peptidase [Tenuifilum thalassicum]